MTVSGPESIIDKVNKNMINLNIDAGGLLEGEHLLGVRADITRPYRIIKIEPAEIAVTLRKLS
ncbi:MAG: hypothetical protein WBH81_02705 [Tepidanaerobacteraceae bacterium]